MKATFSKLNGLTGGLNWVSNRNLSRLFSSVNLALYPLSSSEDETPFLNNSSGPSTSLNCVSAERIKRCAYRNYATPEYRFPGCSVPKFLEPDNDEIKVMTEIFTKHGWSFGYFNWHGVDLDETSIIRALNALFNETGGATLSFRFFRWSELSLGLKHTVRSICTLIHILVLGNMNYRVVDLLKILIHGHLKPEELVNLLQEICTRKVLETVYSMLVYCYSEENMIDEALQAICLIEEVGIFPSAMACNSLLKCLLNSDRVEMAWDLLEELQGRSLVSTITISLFIYYYCSKGNLECGWKLLTHMKTYGIKPDVVAYTIFIHFLCKKLCLKEATCLVFKMIETGISADSVLLSSIIYGYCKMGRPGDAICILKLFNVRPNVFVYNCFISKLCKDGDMQKASTVLREMSDTGIRPDCFIYTTMINGYCKARNRRKALQYLGRMLKDGIEPSVTTYTILIDSHCKSGAVEVAQNLLQKMTRKGLIPDTVVYNTLINGYTNKGQLEKVYELLGMMQSTGISPDVITYNTIVHGLVMRGFVSEAKDILDELILRGFSPDVVTFTNVIGGYSNKGQFADAFLVWSYMSDRNVSPDVITCSALINGYCRAHRMVEARALFHKMLGFGLVPDVILYNILIHGFCRSGNIEEACHVINMMVENNVLPNDVTYKSLIFGYEKNYVQNPVESALYKVHQILQRHDIDAVRGSY